MGLTSGVLGRGLGSLLPGPGSRDGRDGTPLYVSVTRIHPRADQPRRFFDEQALRQLAVSIREQGVLQPLVVTPEQGGGYSLIAGERRLRAAKFAGLTEVPVVVRHANKTEAYELALIENIQREDLNPIEESEAFRRLIDEHQYTQEALARRVGKDRTTISNALRLLKLREPLRDALLRGGLSAGHARALLGTDDEALQDDLLQRIQAEGLSVRTVERLVAVARNRKPAKRKADPFRSERRQLAGTLQGCLGRNVAIRAKSRGKGGVVTIAYADEADLRALVGRIS